MFSHQISVFHDNIVIDSNTIYAAKTNRVGNFIDVGTVYCCPKFLQDELGIYALRNSQTSSAESEFSYGWSKLIGEHELKLVQSNDFNVGLLRLHNVYGPYSDFTATTGQVIPSLIRKALKFENENFTVWGSGKQYRDFIYVDDVVDSLLLMLDKGMNKGVIQIGSGKVTTINKVASIVNMLAEAKFQSKMDIVFDNLQPEDDKGKIAVLHRASNILGWKPTVRIEDGISETMSWMKEHQEKTRVLVIIIGQARGGDLSWKSLHKFLLRPLQAHLALYLANAEKRTLLHDLAQYIWTIPSYPYWDGIFEKAAETCNTDEVKDKWRNYCQIPGIFMGGISNCSHPASSGMLLALRWLVQQKIYEFDLLKIYDWFILTRADELYLCNHHNFLNMNKNHLLLPPGEIGDVIIKCSRSVSSFAISIALDHKKRLNFRIGNFFRQIQKAK
ncbi:unnamed protein product [Rotaria sp. Silwood1]|nr:unnamed protein product [Rotaria sp. Silwood1]